MVVPYSFSVGDEFAILQNWICGDLSRAAGAGADVRWVRLADHRADVTDPGPRPRALNRRSYLTRVSS